MFFAYGQQALLDCHFRSNPPLTNLRWEKDGFLYDPYNVKDVFYKRNGSLFFSSVDDAHAGKYTCTPFNTLGSEGPSSIIKVFVQHPPEFTLKPKSVYIRKLADSVTMHCSARDKHTDDDRLLIAWTRKDGIPLPFGRHAVEGGNLTLENITANDRGVYTCSAINEASKIDVDAELMIETFSPKAPSNLTANSSKDAVTLRWVQNYIRPDLKFSVWYRPVDAMEWRTHQEDSSTSYQSTIENLEPGREYEFMVLSQDRYNDGLFSKAFRYRTKGLQIYFIHKVIID
jgi:immunoglobulin superfamily member 9B